MGDKKKNVDLGKSFDIEIFAAGEWNGDQYTKKDLDDMVKNFQLLADEIKPPLKLGHNDEQMKEVMKDGQPALGWVKALRRVGDKLIGTVAGVPEKIFKAITSGLYKRVSAEIYWDLKDASGNVYNRVLSAVALLGSDIPAVTVLQDLDAYFSQKPDSFKFLRSYVFDITSNKKIENQKEVNDTMDEKQKMEYEDKIRKLQADKEKAEKEAIEAKEREQNLQKKAFDRAYDKARSMVKAFCEGLVKKSCMKPEFRDKIVDTVCDAEKKRVYFNLDHGIMVPFSLFQKALEDHKPVKHVGKEFSHNADSDDDEIQDGAQAARELDKKIRQYMAQNKVDYLTAHDAVIEMGGDIVDAYVDANVE